MAYGYQERPTPKFVELLAKLELDDDTIRQYRDVFQEEIKLGLSPDTYEISSLKCYVTYVHDLPTGDERGKYLALDLGGTNFRVLVVKKSRRYFDVRAKAFKIPAELMKAPGEELFDHIADCLYQFTTEHKINHDNLPLGFTFSFPLEQRGLEVGILTQWTKGFSCPGVEGQNVVELLKQAIERKRDLIIDVVAVLNDTTGTLMSCAWKKSNAKIGLIIGTGTNSCYVEKIENVPKFEGDRSKPFVVINTESGAFGSGGQVDFVRTKWDKDLDAESINPGVNIMEKMISGMYLGEFVRRLLVTAVEREFIFEGVATEKLKTSGSFESKYVSDIEGDLPGQNHSARKVLNSLGYGSPTEQDCVDLHYACFIAWQRAGRMVSAQMAALLNHMDYKDVTIGVDGSLYRFHPGFADLMNKKIRELTDPSIQFKCVLAEDGSGRGAALVAAVARRDKFKCLVAEDGSGRGAALLASVARRVQTRGKGYSMLPSEVCIAPWVSSATEGVERDEVDRWLNEPDEALVELPWMDVPGGFDDSLPAASPSQMPSFSDGSVGIRPGDLMLTDEGVVLSQEGSRVVSAAEDSKGRGAERSMEAESGIVRDMEDASRTPSGTSSKTISRGGEPAPHSAGSVRSGVGPQRSMERDDRSLRSGERVMDVRGSTNLSSIQSSRMMMKEAVFDHTDREESKEAETVSNIMSAKMTPESVSVKEEVPEEKKIDSESKTNGSILGSQMTSSRILAISENQYNPNDQNMMSKMLAEVSYVPEQPVDTGSPTEARRSSSRRGSRESQGSRHRRRRSDNRSGSMSRSPSRLLSREEKRKLSNEPSRQPSGVVPIQRASRDQSKTDGGVRSREASTNTSQGVIRELSRAPSREPNKDASKANIDPSKRSNETEKMDTLEKLDSKPSADGRSTAGSKASNAKDDERNQKEDGKQEKERRRSKDSRHRGSKDSGGSKATRGSKDSGGSKATRESKDSGGSKATRESKDSGGSKATRESKDSGGSKATRGSKDSGGSKATRGSKDSGGSKATRGSKDSGGAKATTGSKDSGVAEETTGSKASKEKNENQEKDYKTD